MSELNNAISDDQLKGVSGGFKETEGNAAGLYISCPHCGASDRSNFDKWIDLTKGEMYRCRNCGTEFSYDQSGGMTNNSEINLA